jgi:FG-GAP-like repeat/Cep192 domain 4
MKALRFIPLFTILFTGFLAAQTTRLPLVDEPTVPASVAPGGPMFTLTVNGTGFSSGALIDWDGHPQPTILVSSSQLKATIPGKLIQSPGTKSISVQNPSNHFSNAVFLQVIVPAAFNGVPFISTYSAGSSLERVATADFNKDGKLDIAASDAGFGDVSILLGNGDGTFPAAQHLPAGTSPLGIVAGDFNGDRNVDVAVTNSGTANTVSVLMGNGDGTFQPPVGFATGTNPVSVTTADVNADGFLDLIVCNHDSATVSVLLGNGDGTFQPEMEFAVGAGPAAVVVGDFNGDGRLDLAVADQDANTVSLLRGNGDGTFRNKVDISVDAGPICIVAADFNNDGVLDLVTANSAAASVSVLIGKPNGSFQPQVKYRTLNAPQALVPGDINGDGKLDLAAADATNVSMLLGNGDGTFQRRVDYSAKKYLALATGDFNCDGRLDLAAVGGTKVTDVVLQTSVSLSNTSANFGNQMVGTMSNPKTATLRNLGTTALNVSGISVTGTDAGDFTQTNNCGTSVAARGSCQIRIVFAPTATGVRNATVQIEDDAVGGVQSISVTGTGT